MACNYSASNSVYMEPTMQGHLEKKGIMGKKTKYWCFVQGSLLYQENEKEKVVNTLDMSQSHQVHKVPSDHSGTQFEIVLPKKKVCFICPNAENCANWVKALRESMITKPQSSTFYASAEEPELADNIYTAINDVNINPSVGNKDEKPALPERNLSSPERSSLSSVYYEPRDVIYKEQSDENSTENIYSDVEELINESRRSLRTPSSHVPAPKVKPRISPARSLDKQENVVGGSAEQDNTDPASSSETYADGSSGQIYDEGSSPQSYNEGSSPQIYNEGSSPQIYNEGSSPQIYNEGSSPQICDEGSSPQTDDESSAQIYDEGSSGSSNDMYGYSTAELVSKVQASVNTGAASDQKYSIEDNMEANYDEIYTDGSSTYTYSTVKKVSKLQSPESVSDDIQTIKLDTGATSNAGDQENVRYRNEKGENEEEETEDDEEEEENGIDLLRRLDTALSDLAPVTNLHHRLTAEDREPVRALRDYLHNNKDLYHSLFITCGTEEDAVGNFKLYLQNMQNSSLKDLFPDI